ncbi:MAG: hypothetical protein H6555_09110 [Lewinellaceae bacterium]|nr:hypothetical protein [Lewinellaceae bacterium]
MKHWISTSLLFLLGLMAGMAQTNIFATEVESWQTNTLPSSDFNLNSSYVYLVNPQALSDIFSGAGLSRSEKKDVGIKKGDYPQYMYLAVSIKDPINAGNNLTIPLMIHDTQDPNTSTRLLEYGGRVLENIPDEVLKSGDIVARVKFEAIKGNSSNEFWKKTAEISVDLGKTASNLLKVGLAGPFLALTDQIMPQVDKGLRSMEKMEDPQKLTSEFYIKLLSKELSALYEERVVSASLYRIHWDVDQPPKSRYFTNMRPQRVDDVRRAINTTSVPYILVVTTKSEYNTDHSELVYNQSYIEKKTKDFRKIQNATKKDAEREFLEVLKQAVELKKQVDIFQGSLNTKYPDWLAFSKVVDLYHDIRELQLKEVRQLASVEAPVQEKYTRLYTNVLNDVDLWFNTELLVKGREIARYLVNNPDPYRGEGRTGRQIYQDIEVLDFFRDRVKQTEIQGKLPKEIESLDTYTLTLRKLWEMENTLFNVDFQPDNRLTLEAKKDWLMARATRDYPMCQVCAQRVGERIAAIENASHEENIRKYKEISTGYYTNLQCYEEVFRQLENYLKIGKDSLGIAPFILESIRQDRDDLVKLTSNYIDLVGRDYTTMSTKDLSDLMSRYQMNREKSMAILQRLKGRIISLDEQSCVQTGF